MHVACASGHLDMVKMLCEEYKAKSFPDRFGMLPMHEASNPNVKKYMFEREVKEIA